MQSRAHTHTHDTLDTQPIVQSWRVNVTLMYLECKANTARACLHTFFSRAQFHGSTDASYTRMLKGTLKCSEAGHVLRHWPRVEALAGSELPSRVRVLLLAP